MTGLERSILTTGPEEDKSVDLFDKVLERQIGIEFQIAATKWLLVPYMNFLSAYKADSMRRRRMSSGRLPATKVLAALSSRPIRRMRGTFEIAVRWY